MAPSLPRQDDQRNLLPGLLMKPEVVSRPAGKWNVHGENPNWTFFLFFFNLAWREIRIRNPLMSRKRVNVFVPAVTEYYKRQKPIAKINNIIKNVRNRTDVYRQKHDMQN